MESPDRCRAGRASAAGSAPVNIVAVIYAIDFPSIIGVINFAVIIDFKAFIFFQTIVTIIYVFAPIILRR